MSTPAEGGINDRPPTLAGESNFERAELAPCVAVATSVPFDAATGAAVLRSINR